MDIQDELQVSEFASEWLKAAVNISFTADWMDNMMKDELKDLDISPQQANVLRILRGQNGSPLSTLDIKKRMIQKSADVSRIVDRLHKKGMLNKRTAKDDKRLVEINISEIGLMVLTKIDEIAKQNPNYYLNLTEQEAKDLNYLLNKLRNKDNNANTTIKRNYRAAKKGNNREY